MSATYHGEDHVQDEARSQLALLHHKSAGALILGPALGHIICVTPTAPAIPVRLRAWAVRCLPLFEPRSPVLGGALARLPVEGRNHPRQAEPEEDVDGVGARDVAYRVVGVLVCLRPPVIALSLVSVFIGFDILHGLRMITTLLTFLQH